MRAVGRLGAMRGRAESRMASRATIRHQSGTTTGPDGFEVPAWAEDYTARPCRLDKDTSSTTVVVGDASQEAATRVLHLPADTRLVDGAVARIDSGEWAGTFWRVTEATGADQKTALRVRVEQVTEPKGWL